MARPSNWMTCSLGVADRAPDWKAVANEIRQAILERGYDTGIGAFTQAFESQVLDPQRS